MTPRRSRTLSASALPSYLDVPPRFGTLRNFDRPTYGERAAKVSQLMGKPFMPWQRYISDVMGEVDPKTGLRVYDRCYVTAPRQQGKTQWLRTTKAHRALDASEPQTILFAAQDGNEAKAKWLADANFIKGTMLRKLLLRGGVGNPVTTNGKELLTWINGSTERPISTRPASGHGVALDLGAVTEAFSQTDSRYEITMIGAMGMRPDSQFLVESTAGDATSLWWNEIVEAQRARMRDEPDRPTRTAFFDWSADPIADDLNDPITWRRVLPALPHGYKFEIVESAFEAATSPKKLREFYRSFLNVTDQATAGESIFEDGQWEATAEDSLAIVGRRALALDITPDRAWSAIAWAGDDRLGRGYPELVAYDRGTHWVKRRLAELLQHEVGAVVHILAGSAAALMESDLVEAGIKVRILDRFEGAAAFARFSDAVVTRTMPHRAAGQGPLDQAVEETKWSNGDQRRFLPLSDTSVIAPSVAAALALYGWQVLTEEYRSALDSIA